MIDLKSSTVLSVGILKNFSSSDSIFFIKGLTMLSNGSIIIETTYSIHSSPVFFSNQMYNLLNGFSFEKSNSLSKNFINFCRSKSND